MTNVPELISIAEIQQRTRITPRRLAALIRGKVIQEPDVVNETGVFYHRSRFIALRDAIHNFQG